ncbi:hypothetical protein KUTeg_014434 [Tegillarca granosa]|uniref:Uncharacterized protein n=1 Tax=Tegillarca granosa TaxID=220873 RepID=A0ABQ9EWI6_TEGGR|nr:hypothetical protein KUTeg_014434 [Tegillarca granosa]
MAFQAGIPSSESGPSYQYKNSFSDILSIFNPFSRHNRGVTKSDLIAVPLLSTVFLGSALWCIARCHQLDKPLGPWKMVFKATAGVVPSGYNDIMSFYQASGSLNDDDATERVTLTTSGTSYKSPILDNWSNHAISAVRLSVFKDGQEKQHIVFDATGKNKNNWMDCTKILYSSYTDITSSSFNFCDIE